MRLKKLSIRLGRVLSLTPLMLILVSLSSYSLCQTFYQGKTITIIQGSRAGGTGDLRIKAAIPFLKKYMPGNPTIVSEYMPGGGGRKAANYLYNVAQPDGLTLGSPGSGFVPLGILKEAGVKYDIDKFIYLGSGHSRTNFVFFTMKEAGLNSLEKVLATPGIRFGAHSVGHSVYVRQRVFAYLLGLKDPKWVTGYSGPDLIVAIRQGEFDAQVYNSYTIIQRLTEWIDKRLADFHVVEEIPKGFRIAHPAFDDLPTLDRFAKTDMDKKILRMNAGFNLLGAPYILPPKTPKEQVDIVSEAMRKTFKDPEFAVLFKKMTGDDPSPLFPEDQMKVITEIPRDTEALKIFKRLTGAGTLPPR